MLSTRPRRSTSAASYSEDSAAKISQQLEVLKAVQTNDQVATSQRHLSSLQLLRQLLDTDGQNNHVRDAFRHLYGFETILDHLKGILAGFQDCKGENGREVACQNVAEVFRLLEHALRDHWGNRRFFLKRVYHGGWKRILQTVTPTVLEAKGDKIRLAFQVVSSLQSLALENSEACAHYSREPIPTLEEVKATLAQQTRIPNPEAFEILTHLWSGSIVADSPLKTFSRVFPLILRASAELSIHALHSLHSTRIPGLIFRYLDYDHDNIEDIKYLAARLLRLGVSSTEDAALLYARAPTSKSVAALLCGALKIDPLPPHVHFDLSAEGFSSIELPNIGKAFPPPSSSYGYTLSLWLNIVHYDPENHTTIFGAFDASQTCFVLVYLERDTHNLILQTSINSSRPSVRFKSVAFETSRWYHVSIVHRRAKGTSSSRASLYVDGEFAEQVKIQFPDNPAPISAGRWTVNDQASGQKQRPVQAFLGTPADLAARKGQNPTASQWKLASAHLYGITLSDELIAVHKELGPRYFGNYQDCLGSFQTYETSAALNLKNDTLHPGKEEESEIVLATRSKASDLVPEAQILFSLSPMFVIDDDEGRDFDGTQLAHSLSRTSQHSLRQMSRGGRSPVVINAAIPSVGTALAGGGNAAIITGGSSVITPHGLDEAAFNVHGCVGVGLSLLEMAEDADAFCQALEILFGTIKHSWRNSEAMERENGYGILSILLESKLRKLAIFRPPTIAVLEEKDSDDEWQDADAPYKDVVHRALELLLDFVGYRKDKPENSVICNPLAYRVLLVDMDIWRLASSDVQKLYYSQFATFIRGSKHHLFNARRLARMRIIKKWLDVLKGEPFYPSTIQYFTDAFRQIFTVAPASDSMRSLALFIAYGLETRSKPSSQGLRHSRSTKFNSGFGPPARRSTAPSEGFMGPGPQNAGPLDSQKLGRAMLETYADVICHEEASVARKFARSVSSRWLLNLVGDNDQTVVIQGCRILARVLAVNGQGYVEKFCSDKTGGPMIMRNFLRRRWTPPALWVILLGIFFGQDVSKVKLDQPFDIAHLLMAFPTSGLRVAVPEILIVLVAALQQGLKVAIQDAETNTAPPSPTTSKENARPMPNLYSDERTRSASVATQVHPLRLQTKSAQQHKTDVVETIIRFLTHVHLSSQAFRDFCIHAPFVQELVFILYPQIVSSDVVGPEIELNSKDSSLNFHGEDVVIRPISQRSSGGTSIVRTLPVETGSSPNSNSALQARPLRRTSSYVLVTSYDSADDPVTPQLSTPFSPKKTKRPALPRVSNRLVEELLELIIAVFTDQLLTRKDFAGIGLYKRLPPGFQEHQAYFASFVLRNTLSHLGNTFRLNQDQFLDSRILTNLARFAIHLRETVFEGWFIDGAESVLEFLGAILEHLQRPEVATVKSVRLCTEQIASIRWAIERVVLLRLSEIDASQDHSNTVALLTKITYWHGVIFHEASQKQFTKLFFYLLYTKLVSHNKSVAVKAADLCRILLVQQEGWLDVILNGVQDGKAELAEALGKIQELDNDSFLIWLTEHRSSLDKTMFDHPAALWEDFVKAENKRTEDSAKERITRRREKLRDWARDDSQADEVIRKYETSAGPWRANIYRQEHDKRLKSLQDEQDNRVFNVSSWKKLRGNLARPAGFLDDGASPAGWQLDRTEGPNRMRMRLIPDAHALARNYRGKEAANKGKELSIDIKQALKIKHADGMPSPASGLRTPTLQAGQESTSPDARPNPQAQSGDGNAGEDDEFEIVEDMNDGVDGFEDKNRKVMRSLQRGDRVEHVCNAARIIGLEAIEAILIVGKHHLYMIDNYFVREDAEIVSIWQAPQDERDAYLQLISGRQAKDRQVKPVDATHETRHWRWEDVLSISKRRFLFREVGIEIFFVDGQSFLLTMKKPKSRDELHNRLYSKAQSSAGVLATTKAEDAWRLDLLRTPEDTPQSLGQTFGSKFSNVFNNSSSNPATRKWMKGELSNFNYLMLINTMAGRTFNDLTQYPVFPWVLADYTSDELDLTNPRTFRDLTKPMGCQTAEREAEFRERYKQFAEMGDANAPPFHYGTHYSSAMIVTSYLVRVQPFVHSYLLLQGGSFDHPDRMFYSVEKAWNSASRDNMSDVRELIPEFFYLPEMFTNTNGYDFGARQGTGGRIDDVALPPWAKGDPRIFIAKNREALESDFVSKRLHAWIDLVFGHKQAGEAALEATNVFHHLSYRGSKNLDDIHDPVERLATIGIIHNFGQTPFQVFQRTHPLRENLRHGAKKLDSLTQYLTRLPFPVLEAPERIAHILWDAKREKLVCSGALKVNAPPFYDRYLEWGLVDGGIRFYNADNQKLVGLFEHVHQTQLNACTFVDSRTLVTAGLDCVVSVWSVANSTKGVDLTLKANFFGHKRPVNTLATSSAFSTLLTADESGTVMTWDLNRLELVRVFSSAGASPRVGCAAINHVNGMILLCRGPTVAVYTLNGELLLDQHISTDLDDTISTCTFYENNPTEYSARTLFFTGHKRGVANAWSIRVLGGKWVLDHIKRMNQTEEHSGVSISAAITAILPRPLKVYTGDEDGRVYEWDCVQHG